LAHSTLTCAQNAFRGLYPEFAPPPDYIAERQLGNNNVEN